MKLWIDDVRPAPDDSWTIAVTSSLALTYLSTNFVAEVSFDNDLGLASDMEGWEIARWLLNQVHDKQLNAPLEMSCHSANPVARKRINDYIEDIKREVSK